MDKLKAALEECTDRDPWCSGLCTVPKEDLLLYFKDKSGTHLIDLTNASEAELDQLCDACEPELVTVDGNTVQDEMNYNSLRLDKSLFATNFSPDRHGFNNAIDPPGFRVPGYEGVMCELSHLNVYGQGSFSKPNKDETRKYDKLNVGTLLVILPITYEGGKIVLRESRKGCEFDFASILKGRKEPAVAFTAFSYGKSEIKLVTSGKLLMLTYKLYYAPIPGPVVRTYSDGFQLQRCTEALNEYLRDPTVFPNGGYVGFGLVHKYKMEGISFDWKKLHLSFRGFDALLYKACKDVGLEISPAVIYESELYRYFSPKLLDLSDVPRFEGFDIVDLDCRLRKLGTAFEVTAGEIEEWDKRELPKFEWVTPMTKCTVHKETYMARWDSSAAHVYGWVNMVAKIGKPSERNT